MFLSFLPDLKHGLLVYDSDSQTWDQSEGNISEANIGIDISSSGECILREGDDDGVFIETSLEGGDEFNELLAFFVSTKADSIQEKKLVSKKLGNLVEQVFLVLPESSTSFQDTMLIPLKGLNLANVHSELAETVEAWMSNDWSEIDRLNYPEIFDLKSLFSNSVKLQHGDLVITGRGQIAFGGMLNQEADSTFGFDPRLVLRPNQSASLMWLFDYFKHALEADGLIQRICLGWKYLPKGLQNIAIETPSTKAAQIADTIERRAARRGYLSYLKNAMNVREPFVQISSVYRKRTEAAKCLHGELLDEITAIRSPLPFFLEYPYRNYFREDDHIRKIKAGQRLLSVLAKVPLYFVVEELLGLGHEMGSSRLEKLTDKPTSDGFMVDMQREIAVSLKGGGVLKCFSSLLDVMADESDLMKIVAARNRMHHEPFDEGVFLAALNENAPILMDRYRAAMKGCRVLIPKHISVREEGTILSAEDICSRDATFKSIDILIEIGVENFPSETIVAYGSDPEQAVALKSLFAAKMITSQSRDLGVFDRMEKNHPAFVFLRSD